MYLSPASLTSGSVGVLDAVFSIVHGITSPVYDIVAVSIPPSLLFIVTVFADCSAVIALFIPMLS